MRLVYFPRFSTEGVAVRLSRGTQIGGVKIAVAVEDLAEAECHRRAGLPLDAETGPTSEVLPQIEQRFTRRRATDAHRAQLAHAPHWWRQGRHERSRRRIEQRNRAPCVVVEGRAHPAAKLSPRVVSFAAIDVRREHRSRRHPPGGVRHHARGASALIADLELRAQGQPPAIEIALAEEPEISPIPAIAQHRADGVGARSQQRGHIVGLVLQPPAV